MPLDPSQELLLPLLNASPVPMLVSELGNGRVVAANARAEELFETAAASVVGLTTIELGFWESPQQREAFVASVRSDGEGRLERVVRRPDGTTRQCILCSRILEGSSDPPLVVSTLLDTTEIESMGQRRRAAEDAQRVAEERLKLILENSFDGLWDWNVATGEVYFSPRYYRILGYEPGEFPASFVGWKDNVHPDDLSRVEAALQDHFRDPACPYLVEFRMRHKDGAWVWIEAHGSVLERDPDGLPLRMVGTHSDIGRRKAAEEDLHHSRQRLELVLDNTVDGLWDWNLATGESFFSPRYYQMLGFDPGEAKPGLDELRARIHPDDLEAVEEVFRKHFADPSRPYSVEYRMRHKDGFWMWWLAEGRIIERDPEGKPLRLVGTHTDVTLRREAQDATLRSERRLDQIVHSLAEGVILLDSEGTVLQANTRAHEILHIPDGVLKGVNMIHGGWSFLYADGTTMPPEEQPGWHTLQDGQPRLNIDVGVNAPDGSIVWISVSTSLLEDGPEGTPRLLLVSFSDVTGRKQQEETLRRREADYRLLADNSTDVVCRIDNDGNISYISPSVEAILGWPAEAFLGKSAREGIHPDDLPEVYRIGALATPAGDGPRAVYRLQRRDGTWIRVEASLRSLRDPDGNALGMITSSRDMTARWEAEEERRRSEERFREVADMSQDMLSRHDMDGICLWASPACRNILRIEPHQVVGRSAFEFIVSDDHDAVRDALERLVREGTSRLQYRIRRTDGSILWSETIWGLTYDPEGNPLEIHCSTRDISEQKRQSDLLRTTQRIAHLGGWETDVATGDTTWTEELFRIHEIDEDRYSTRNIRSMLPYLGDSSRDAMLAAHRKLMEDGTPWSLVLRGVTTKGNPLVIQSTCEGVFEDGRLRTLRGTTQDITQQDSIRQQLESISRLNASILSTTEALIVLLDRNGRVVRFNPACERLTGWLEMDLLGKPFFDLLIPANERATVEHVFQNLTAGMFPNQYENHWITRQGEMLWISWANSVLLDDAGTIQYVLGTGIDMTAHRATQLELLDSQEKWRILIENAPEAIVILDLDADRFLEANPSAERLFGLPRSTLLKLGPSSVSPEVQPDGRPSDIAAFDWIQRAITDGSVSFEWVHRRADGRDILCLLNLSLLPPGADGHRLIRGSIVDITERRKTESVLEALVRGTASHFGQAFFDVLVKDLAQLLDVRYAYIARIQAGEVRTLSFFADGNLAVPIRHPLADSPCERVLGGGPFFSNSGVRELYPSSRLLQDLEADSYMGVPLVNAAQEPIGVLAVLDSRPMPESELARAILTIFAGRAQGEVERLEAEQALRQLNIELEHRVHKRTSELQASNRELESFSYSVSHDLRSPLRSVDGFAQALQEDYGPLLDATGLDYLGRIRAASHRMADLIDDLLSLSRSSRTALHKDVLDLSGMASEILGALRESDPQRNVETRIQPDLEAFADPVLMRSVLENLLGNAWKYSRNRDPAVIEFRSADASDGFVGFSIADNGAGFDMAHANRLFRTFQRLHGAEEFEGNGIGLATVRRILERHGGSITGEGAIGKGATFHFRLPHVTLPDADRDSSSPLPRD